GRSSFDSVKQIDAGVLNVGYAESGPANGPPVILLHGWPYDIHAFVDVAPILAAKGYRVIIPHLRGYGTTRFLSADTMRNGEQAAIAVNVAANLQPLPPKAELGWWYQYYFATERGVLGYSKNTYDFNKLIWQLA